MEIGQYLRARPWSAVIALLFPLLAGLTAYGLLQGSPDRYVASANVRVPESVGGSASIGIFAADFALAAESDTILSQVAQDTGTTIGGLRNNLDVERLGQSSRLTVSYTNRDRARAEQVLRAFIPAALLDLTTSQAAAANLKAGQDANAKAAAALTAFQEQNSLDPQRDYTDYANSVRELEAQGIAGPQLQAAIDRRELWKGKVREFATLEGAAESARERLDTVQEDSRSSTAAAAEARNPGTIENFEVDTVSQTPRIVQGVGVAAVLGLLCGLAVLVLPDLLRRPAPVRPTEVGRSRRSA